MWNGGTKWYTVEALAGRWESAGDRGCESAAAAVIGSHGDGRRGGGDGAPSRRAGRSRGRGAVAMFRGRYEHAVDGKGRVSVPSGFRVELQRRSESAPIITPHQDHLVLHPADAWEKTEQELLAMPDLDPDVQRYRLLMLGDATACPIDGQGRILMPAFMRSLAALDGKAAIVGVLDRIEIWSPARYEETRRTTLLRLDEIQRSVDRSRRAADS